MEIETRQAALCVIVHNDTFLVAEITDPHTGVILHRPPGGGMEAGENPEQAVRRELREELGVTLTRVHPLGAIDHVWFWKGREVRERAWLLLASSSDHPRLNRGETLELIEANGQRFKTLWRALDGSGEKLPPMSPSTLVELLRTLRISAVSMALDSHGKVELMAETNPFQDALRFERRVPPCAIVIFGANGDLTKRKLIPALYRLAYERRLPSGFVIYGNSRTPMSDDDYRAKMKAAVQQFLEESPFEEDLWTEFAKSLFYLPGDLLDPNFYQTLAERLAAHEAQTAGNMLFYLSTQPSHYEPVAQGLGAAGLARSKDQNASWRRLVVEKPFGHDLHSAVELNQRLQAVFPEKEIYRIDHYLGKETVQNILAFRFANGIFEPLWNRRYVNHVQITAAESIGVEGRGAYYSESGALRDMIQNHLLQVMATIGMEPTTAFEADVVRDERAKLLRSIRILKEDEVPSHTVKGQYGPGRVGGADLLGFRQEPGVSTDSQTDTYAAVTFFVDNWRWAGVPFYIRTGKRLPKRVTDIAIHFNAAPLSIFNRNNDFGGRPNLLIIRIQPEEGISLRFLSKSPGGGMSLRPVSMDFNYGSSFGERTPTAYETLLMDAMAGDATLYTRQDMVDASWRVVQPILDYWSSKTFPLPNYESGTWGPKASDEMLARRGHVWRIP